VLKRSLFAAVFAVAAVAVPAKAQDTVQLKWDFQKDKPFYQTLETTTKQNMVVMGMNITQNQSQTFYFSWTPKEQKNGNWIIEQKIEGVKMNIEIGGNTITYDSTKDSAAAGNPLADFFKALIGSSFKIELSPELKVVKIDGRDDFIAKLVKSSPQMEPLLKQILGDDALKQMADPAFGAVPKTPVKKGQTWENKSSLSMGPIGSYNTTYKYTYEGKEGNLDKIKVDTNLTYQPPGPAAAGALPFKIKEAKLQSKDATGTVLFDNNKHRLASSNMGLKLAGTLKIDIGGMETEVNLDQDQKTTVSTSDTNPAAAAPTATTPKK
jgi:hypothetical protein